MLIHNNQFYLCSKENLRNVPRVPCYPEEILQGQKEAGKD